jgi:hypothetical protein
MGRPTRPSTVRVYQVPPLRLRSQHSNNDTHYKTLNKIKTSTSREKARKRGSGKRCKAGKARRGKSIIVGAWYQRPGCYPISRSPLEILGNELFFTYGALPQTPVHSFLYKKERNQEKVSPAKSSGRFFDKPPGS